MHVYTSESSVKMEVEAAELATVYMKYMESPATVGKLTASAPVGLRVQQTNIAAVLTTRCTIHQHTTSELPMLTPIPEDYEPEGEICLDELTKWQRCFFHNLI